MFFKKRKRKYKYLPIEYYIAIIIGFFIGKKFPSYLHITSKIFSLFSLLFFTSFAAMYVLCYKILNKELLIKEEDKQENNKK